VFVTVIYPKPLKLSVGVTSHPYLLEFEGLFTQGWRPDRTFGESVGVIFVMDSSDWSNGIRYPIFDTRPDTEFKVSLKKCSRQAKRWTSVSLCETVPAGGQDMHGGRVAGRALLMSPYHLTEHIRVNI